MNSLAKKPTRAAEGSPSIRAIDDDAALLRPEVKIIAGGARIGHMPIWTSPICLARTRPFESPSTLRNL